MEPTRTPHPRRAEDKAVQDLAEAALSNALIDATRKLGVKALIVVFAALLAGGLWVKSTGAQAAQALSVADSALRQAAITAAAQAVLTKTTSDLMLMQCAQPGLSNLEQRICAPYFPRMPR